MVNRHVLPGHGRPGAERQLAVAQGQVRVGRDEVNVVDLDRHALGHLADGQRRNTAKNLGKVAFMVRFEVGDKYERHTGLERQFLQQLGKCLHPALDAARDWQEPRHRQP